ncbi:MAG: ABC transporter ATP-binding protein [Lachnospiraceae bacterium]
MKLSVENGCFSYEAGHQILKDINFSVESGELLAILGPNGAGKTTLLRCIMGFLSWERGRSLLDGEEMHRMSQKKLWQKIGYVPQAKINSSALPVSDMILLGCTNRLNVFETPGEAERTEVEKIAGQLGIHSLLHKKCNEISGGELQMVLIARALAARPKLLVLDEPESNLDFKNQLIVLDTMSGLVSEGMCCIFNTHYPTHALMRADKSLILQKNGEAFFGKTQQIITEENIESAFSVETVIGEVKRHGNIYRSILPLRISEGENKII